MTVWPYNVLDLTPILFLSTQYPTRQHHSKHFIIPSNWTTAYQKSFYPTTIRDWNDLPSSSIETTDVEEFIRNLTELNII